MTMAVLGETRPETSGDGNADRCTGTLLRFLLSGELACGESVLVETVEHRGSEPSPRVSGGSDAAFYVLEGDVAFLIDGQRLHAVRGTSVSLPKGVEYSYSLLSERARLLIMTMPSRPEDDRGRRAELTGAAETGESSRAVVTVAARNGEALPAARVCWEGNKGTMKQ